MNITLHMKDLLRFVNPINALRGFNEDVMHTEESRVCTQEMINHVVTTTIGRSPQMCIFSGKMYQW